MKTLIIASLDVLLSITVILATIGGFFLSGTANLSGDFSLFWALGGAIVSFCLAAIFTGVAFTLVRIKEVLEEQLRYMKSRAFSGGKQADRQQAEPVVTSNGIESDQDATLDDFRKPIWMTALQARMQQIGNQCGDIYLSDVRDAILDLHEEGLIPDLAAAKIEIGRLIDKEEIDRIDDNVLEDLRTIIDSPSIDTVDDLVAAMDAIIEGDPSAD